MRILDMNDDLGASFKTYVTSVGVQNLPEVVKTAAWKEPASAHDRDFALILIDEDGSEHRKYACHDPGSTLVSMFYLQNAQPLLNPAAVKTAAANLARLAGDWGMDVGRDFLKLAQADLPADALRDVVDERRVRYHAPQERFVAKVASGPFAKLASVQQEWHDMTPHARRAAVVDLQKEASTLPLVLPDHFLRYGGTGVGEKFATHMRIRQDCTNDMEIAAEYATLAKTASLFDPEAVIDAVYILDDLAGLRWHGGDKYGEHIADPVRCVYDTNKTAAFLWNRGADFVSEHSMEMFRHRSGARQLFTSVFTDDLWQRFDKDPVATFKAMPEEQKHLLSRMARGE